MISFLLYTTLYLFVTVFTLVAFINIFALTLFIVYDLIDLIYNRDQLTDYTGPK
jgi:hypothetical protein